jgi:hypothetical protein
MDKTIMCVVEEFVNSQNQNDCRIKSIRPVQPGDKSSSVKQAVQETADLSQQQAMKEIVQSQGEVKSEDLTFDPALDNTDFKVEDA